MPEYLLEEGWRVIPVSFWRGKPVLAVVPWHLEDSFRMWSETDSYAIGEADDDRPEHWRNARRDPVQQPDSEWFGDDSDAGDAGRSDQELNYA